MKKIVLMSFMVSSVIMAGGYKIPETSTNAVALGAANIAHNHQNADAAYYNPAKMVFMFDKNQIEADLTYIHLGKVDYNGMVRGTGPYALASESENFYVPTLHYVSPKLGNNDTRIGLSIVSPCGLSKRWDTEPAKTSAQEFTLKTIEINPSVAFKFNDKLAVAIGLRVLYSDGIVKSDGHTVISNNLTNVSRDMTGDSIDFGYNIALAYNPTKELEIGATYRSKINMTVEGNANLNETLTGSSYNGPAYVDLPLPATFDFALAYTFPTQTTVEVVYERAFWSAYKSLNFSYDGTQSGILNAIFATPRDKDWKDVSTFRMGVTQELDTMTLMAGLVIDESPVPEKTIGFELPDTNAISVSLGTRYKINDKIDLGLSALYSMHESRTVSSAVNDNTINGEFSKGDIVIISAGLGYKF